jgi:alcohol dehydrogenase
MTAPETPWWSFGTAARIAFGTDCRRFLPDVVRSYGRRIAVITDPNLLAAGPVRELVAGLTADAGLEVLVFDGGQAEVGFDDVETCTAQIRPFGPDVVVGIGGGSNIDLAKVVAARLAGEHPVHEWRQTGPPRVALPVVAVPTTAGSGSEVTPVAVLTDDAEHTKVGFNSRAFLPRAVLVDPVLALSCPRTVTAHAGLDALSHAIEAYLAASYTDKTVQPYDGEAFVGKNPVSDALAIRAAGLIAGALPAAVADGSDLAAREAMALGSLLAGMAFATAGTGIVHALQYPLGVLTKTAHGHGNATLLPAAIRSNLDVRTTAAAELSRAMGETARDDRTAAAALPGRVARLAEAVGVTPDLRSIGVTEEDLPALAATAIRMTRLTLNNPRPVDEALLLGVLRDALDHDPEEPK